MCYNKIRKIPDFNLTEGLPLENSYPENTGGD